MFTRAASLRFVRFGIFEADLQERELRKNGLKVRLQRQPFEVLAALLERPGETVTGEELSRRIWPEGTFVEFDHSLSTAVLKVRRVLGDSAENPRFVETIPRHGYRFIAPVEDVLPGGQIGARRGRALRSRLWVGAFLSIVVLTVTAAVIWFLATGKPESQAPLRIVPLTSYPGWEWMNSFSPDGNQIAFTRCEPGSWIRDGNCDLWVKQLGSEEALRLTTYPGVDGGGAWSPDGRWIAFLRSPPTGTETYYLVPSMGGTERKIADTYPLSLMFGNTISWFPDGRQLVVTRVDSTDGPVSLFLVTIGSDEPRRLTSPLPGSLGDSNPAVSPNGRLIVFSRMNRSNAGGLFLLELTDDLEPRGEPVQLTSDPKGYRDPVWTPDGEEIIFASDGILWRMRVSGGSATRAELLPLVGGRACCPAISPDGRHLAYSQVRGQDDIMRIELSGPGKAAGIPARLISSTRSEMWPEYSPDGGRIAFVSDRSGTFEVWTCDSAGSSLLRVASYAGTFGAKLNWSPEGERIAFSSNREGRWEIVVVQAQGGTLRRLTTELTTVGRPGELTIGWSCDGEKIHFSSDPGNESGIWKIPAAGGEPVRIKEVAGGAFCESSSEEDALYYLKVKPGEPRHQSLWKIDLKDWEQSKVLDSVFRASYAVADTGVYFIPGRDPDCRCYHLQFLDFATGQINTVVDIEDIGEGISVSPDSRSLLFTERSQTNSDVMLVENFR
jgi:Tol biopolymer transport system component/DNA-binding winged helix-turn-helix (wHTH) protein